MERKKTWTFDWRLKDCGKWKGKHFTYRREAGREPGSHRKGAQNSGLRQPPCSLLTHSGPASHLAQLTGALDLGRQPAGTRLQAAPPALLSGVVKFRSPSQEGEAGALLPVLASPLLSSAVYSCSRELQAPHCGLTGRAIRNSHPPLKPLALSTA